MTATSDQVVIVGAGIAGLVTAYELHRRGIPSIVLERGDQIGGRVRTIELADGSYSEAHLEEFWESNPAVELLHHFGLPLVEHPAHSSFIADDALHLMAGTGQCTFRGAQWAPSVRSGFERWNRFGAQIIDELDEARRSRRWSARLVGLQRIDLGSLADELDLPRAVATWLRLIIEAETGVEWDRIAALDGIDEFRPFLVDDSGRARERSYTVEGGNVRFVDELVRRLPCGTVQTGATVHGVVDDGGGVRVRCDAGSGRERVVRGRYAVLAAPVWALRTVDIKPALNSSAQAAMMSTGSGSYVKVVLRLHRGAEHLWDRFDGRLFTLLSDALPGCVYLRDGRTTGRDHVLTALVHGSFARGLHDLPERMIASRVISGLQSLRPRGPECDAAAPLFSAISQWVADVQVFDCPRAVAYWPNVLRRSRFDDLADALRKPHGRILIGGDSTESSHSDGAMRAARRMATLIAEREGAS